jgi:membrane-bound serine protease (ClpP class)
MVGMRSPDETSIRSVSTPFFPPGGACAVRRLFAGVVALITLLLAAGGAVAATAALLQVDGAISPASADYIERGIGKAQAQGASLVVLQIDTPGGLDTSMRQIIKAILASPIPVVAFVSPEGARAASAGTYILYASHVAAMAPATNLGAATPVPLGVPGSAPGDERPVRKPQPADEKSGEKKDENKAGESPAPAAPADAMRAKQVNDAIAYIRSLAELRGRNADWAERAVRDGVSLSAKQALKENVIDMIAADVPALLEALHGREIKVLERTVKLDTEAATLLTIAPDARNRFLSVITNPSVALILMLIGVYGLFFEFSSPSFGVAGVAGGICLLLGLYALQLLPINYAGLGLILLGLALMIAETFLPSFGVLGIGGIVAFVLGATLLIDTEVPGFGIPLPLIVATALISAALLVLAGGLALRSRRARVVSGREEMIGACGEVFDAEGWASVHGERWRVRSAAPLAPGQKVRVTAIDGLTLTVEPASDRIDKERE